MKMVNPFAIVLDTSPLGLLTQRPGHIEGDACKLWAKNMHNAGCLFFVPEIADYELRRELFRHKNTNALARLDTYNFAVTGQYLPRTTPAIRLAAELWAKVRNQGRTTAPPEALDADVFIAAQAELLNPTLYQLSAVVVATANIGHLGALTTAVFWSDIQP